MVVIKNGRVMDPKTGLDQVCDLRIEGKKIVEIAENLPTDGQEVLDATGLTNGIDPQEDAGHWNHQ